MTKAKQTGQSGVKKSQCLESGHWQAADRATVWANLDDTGRDFFKALNEQFSITFESGCVRGD